MNLVQFDPVNQMIPLTVIPLSITNCNLKRVIMILGSKQLFDLDCSETTFYQLKRLLIFFHLRKFMSQKTRFRIGSKAICLKNKQLERTVGQRPSLGDTLFEYLLFKHLPFFTFIHAIL